MHHRLVALTTASALAIASPAAAQARSFDVAAQPAATGILTFARQAGIQVIAPEAATRGRRTAAVRGNLDTFDALSRLIAASGLRLVSFDGRTAVLAPTAAAGDARPVTASVPYAPAQQTGVADASRGASGQVEAPPQTEAPGQTAVTDADPDEAPSAIQDIVVTASIRRSLERAAEIKREAVQVVDSIVAEDIGKLPDPSTAAALQRVPGVQVVVDANNEIAGVRIRGLTDILTTVDGREVFTTTGRGFDLQDLPAEALSRIDVVKSQTADLIEGGVAGVIDLQLNKPFNFRRPTLVLTGRANYASRADAINEQFGALVTDRWDTGIGEIGALLNVTWSESFTDRQNTVLVERRSSASVPANSLVVPAGTPAVLVPNILQNIAESGTFKRPQANGSVQWQVTPEIQAYADALWTKFESEVTFTGFNAQPFSRGVRLTDVQPSENCITARVNAAGQNARVVVNNNRTPADPSDDTSSLEPFSTQTLCEFDRATFQNIVVNQTTQARDIEQVNRIFAGGLRFEQDRAKAFVEASYQESESTNETIIVDVGQRLTSLIVEPDVGNGARFTVQPADLLLTGTSGLFLRNAFQQQFGRSEGDLLAFRAQGDYEMDGFLQRLQFGLRYAERNAEFNQVLFNRQAPGGNFGTITEPTAVSAARAGLPPEFLALSTLTPRLNGGTRFLTPNPDYLRSETGREALRAVYGAPTGRPDFEPQRRFVASEETLAAYGQLTYEAQFGGMELDGVVGVRLTKTDRTIAGATVATVPTGNTTRVEITPVERSTTDTDILPNATARLQFGDGLQSRFSYSKTIRRPEFGQLNPGVNYFFQNNPNVLSTGNAGNPDLRPQKADSYDATLEYYFPNGFAAVAGFYRKITDRVIGQVTLETIDGNLYSISRPRNLGEVELKGVEVSGQVFFDFLPGALSGFGASGAFTYVDSEVTGSDTLQGLPLAGVSKYNYSAGLLYDKFGISGRAIYTFRSRYFEGDASNTIALRSIDSARVNEVFTPTLLRYVRPAGRLDFSIGYEFNEGIRVDVGGTNVLRQETRTYFGESFVNEALRGDETTYTLGVRVRI